MKLLDYVNPISGKKGNLGNVKETSENIAGVVALFGFFAIGQMALSWLGKNLFKGRIPTQASLITNQSPAKEEKQPVNKVLV